MSERPVESTLSWLQMAAPALMDAGVPMTTDTVGLAQASRILGCPEPTIRRLILIGALPSAQRQDDGSEAFDRAAVEQLATEVYPWRRHLDDRESYWVTGQQAADALEISRARLSQLAVANRLTFKRHQDGTRLYRRDDIEAGAVVRR